MNAANGSNQSLGLFMVLLAAYCIPTIVAVVGKHRNAGAIGLLNLFLGWSIIGWVVALIWSITNDPKATAEKAAAPVPAPITIKFDPPKRGEQGRWIERANGQFHLRRGDDVVAIIESVGSDRFGWRPDAEARRVGPFDSRGQAESWAEAQA